MRAAITRMGVSRRTCLFLSITFLLAFIFFLKVERKEAIIAPTGFCDVFTNQELKKCLANTSFTNLIVPNTNSLVRLYHFGNSDSMSRSLMTGDGTWLWHKDIYPHLATILSKDETLNFIDVGANLGYFSLLAARAFQKSSQTHSRRIVTVEANKETAEKTYLSILYNQFDGFITLVQNVITDERGPVSFVNHPHNRDVMHLPGDATFLVKEGPTLTINGIYLDDLLEVITFKRAVLKIDIEGSEYRAFRHAQKLFDEIDIPVVLMESIFKEQLTRNNIITTFFTSRKYFLFSGIEIKTPNLDVNNPKSWPNDIVWKKEPFISS